MSRGPGVHQRAILEEIAEDGYSIITDPRWPDAVQVARRRAARRLDETGRIRVAIAAVEGLGDRLVAFAPDDETAPEPRIMGTRGGGVRYVRTGRRGTRTEYLRERQERQERFDERFDSDPAEVERINALRAARGNSPLWRDEQGHWH